MRKNQDPGSGINIPDPQHWEMKLILQVVSQQLGRLQDTAEKCKTLTKATEAQVSFFQQAHQLNRSH